ncbi:MAG TPA: YkoF family thiamine/hydroxymethylpyrimidine-binding protein [Steroidobacteraceae bacterium]|nr:YkoF family thiamine/hydroxymethylpyrimidine-binding protein [Steroidobacteraceae bacterium]
MHVAVELSLYPLADDFIPPIRDFIDRLKARAGVAVVTNSMSTQVSGEFNPVFDALRAEIARTLEGPIRAVIVMKVLGGAD